MADIEAPFGSPRVPSEEAAQNAAMPSNFYAASGNFAAKTVSVAADRYKLLTPADGAIKIAGTTYYWPTQQTLDLSAEATWDTVAGTDYRTAANRAGKDFYVYACAPAAGITTPIFLVSINASAPTGYTTADSRQVGGFHGLCVAVAHTTTLTAWAADTVIVLGCTRKSTVWNGKIIRCTARTGTFKTHAVTEPNVAAAAVGATLVDNEITWIVEQHALEGYVAGDILPASVWDLKRRPTCSPAGMVKIGGCSNWIDVYLVSGTGAAAVSQYNATYSKVSGQQFIVDATTTSKRLPRRGEFVRAALGSNWALIAGGADPITTGGHSDAYGRRMVSHIGVEDAVAANFQWLAESSGATTTWQGGTYWAGSVTYGPFGINSAAETGTGNSARFVGEQ